MNVLRFLLNAVTDFFIRKGKEEPRTLIRDGVTLVMYSDEKTKTTVHNALADTYTREEHEQSHIFTVPSDLDTWVQHRRSRPEGVAYVLVEDVDLLETESFAHLVKELDMINATVVISLPMYKCTTQIVRGADRVILCLVLRKVKCAERGFLYRAMRPHVTYSTFLETWLRFRRCRRYPMVVDGDVVSW